MIVIPFRPEHIGRLNAQPHQKGLLGLLPADYYEDLPRLGPAFSGLQDGRVVACAGIALQSAVSATLWCFLAENAPLLAVHRAAHRLMGLLPVKELEATSEVGFLPGCRWLELLGFTRAERLPAYGPDGADHQRYVKVR